MSALFSVAETWQQPTINRSDSECLADAFFGQPRGTDKPFSLAWVTHTKIILKPCPVFACYTSFVALPPQECPLSSFSFPHHSVFFVQTLSDGKYIRFNVQQTVHRRRDHSKLCGHRSRCRRIAHRPSSFLWKKGQSLQPIKCQSMYIKHHRQQRRRSYIIWCLNDTSINFLVREVHFFSRPS